MQKTRDLLKKRWQTEYLHALRDQRNKVRPQEVPVPGSVVLITDHLSGNGFKPTWTLAKVLSHVKGKDGVIRGLELKSTSGYTIQRPLELCRDLEIVKQPEEKKSTTPQLKIQCDESTTLDNATTASTDGATSTTKEDGVKSRYTRAKHIRDDFIQPEEETSTTAEHAQRRGKRQAAKNASAINKIVQEEELHTLI